MLAPHPHTSPASLRATENPSPHTICFMRTRFSSPLQPMPPDESAPPACSFSSRSASALISAADLAAPLVVVSSPNGDKTLSCRAPPFAKNSTSVKLGLLVVPPFPRTPYSPSPHAKSLPLFVSTKLCCLLHANPTIRSWNKLSSLASSSVTSSPKPLIIQSRSQTCSLAVFARNAVNLAQRALAVEPGATAPPPRVELVAGVERNSMALT